MSEEMKYTKFEIARMLGSRALQIAMGAPFLVKLSEKQLQDLDYNPIAIAKIELEHDALPLTVKRPLPGKKKAAA
jgi:DNA-directed RNA polymerase subunit K